MTPEEKIAYQNGILTALAINKVVDLSEFKRQEILADMEFIGQSLPKNSTWDNIHTAIRKWLVSGPFVKLSENVQFSSTFLFDMINTLICSDATPLFDVTSLDLVSNVENVTITLV